MKTNKQQKQYERIMIETYNKNKTIANEIKRLPTTVVKNTNLPTFSFHNITKINNNLRFQHHDVIHNNNGTLQFVDDKPSNAIDENDFIKLTEKYISILKQKNVAKIYHVYQPNYVNNVSPTGLGDFIRSCFFIFHFCNKYEFEGKILIKHPIAVFLQNHHLTFLTNQQLLSGVHMFTHGNLKDLHLNRIKDSNTTGECDLYENALPLYTDFLSNLTVINKSIYSYNILFPYNNNIFYFRSQVQHVFQPTSDMVLYIDQTMNHEGIIKKGFVVIHIRAGDKYLIKKETNLNPSFMEEIIKSVNEIVVRTIQPILIISDNNQLKLLIKQKFPNVKTIFNEATHLGEGVALNIQNVKNTMLDFYLMSYASSIYSFTTYDHGTGFSYWCSKLYNIPYSCKFVNNK
tara:strand:- start:106 stop:1311 length:1206 start_codon:yes stop_codon:yes gene_type:complete